MNRHLKRTFVFLALCAAFMLAPPLSRAAGTGRTITVASDTDLAEALKTAQDGDTLLLGSCYVIDSTSKDLPWVINKAVTFQGGEITCHMGGIILSKDVTFRDTKIGFTSYVRDSIMANGHTLTLENVTCSSGTRPMNLFCGGFYTEAETDFGDIPGTGGKIIIRGETSLATNEGVGNIYAGNLCLGGMTADVSGVHGPANTFIGNPEIVIDAEMGSELGRIYAGGAEEKIPEGSQNGKEFLTNPGAYKVSGTVRVQLHAATVDYVNGLGAAETHVIYTDTRDAKFVTDTLGIYCVSSLTVKSGHVSPKADSSFVEGATLAVDPGAKLGLEQMGNVTVGSFSGGGKLSLGQGQTLNVTGDVAGSTCVAIGGFNHEDGSLRQPVAGHVYIRAPLSQTQETAFVLAPPPEQIMAFAYNSEKREWFSEKGQAAEPTVVRTLKFETERAFAASGATEAAMTVVADESAVLEFLPVTIYVNGAPTEFGTDYFYGEVYRYQANGCTLLLYLAGTWPYDSCLSVVPEDLNGTIPDGEYHIEIIVPGSNTTSGYPLTASATLTVGESDLPESGVIGGLTPNLSANTVRILLAAPGGPVKAGTVMAAVYDAQGRMVSFGQVPIPDGGSEAVEVPVALSGGREVRAFLTDAAKPLCPSLRADLS